MKLFCMNKYLILFLLAMTLIVAKTEGQILLTEQIEKIGQKFNLDFSYDDALLKDIKIRSELSSSLEENLKSLQQLTAFKFEKIDSANVLISPISKKSNLLIRGEIRYENGDPAVGSSVYLKEQGLGDFVNSNGEFKFYATLDLKDSVYIEFINGEGYSLPMSYFNPYRKLDTITSANVVDLKKIVIERYLTDGYNYDHSDQSINLNMQELALIPGETEVDVLNSIQAIPGLNSPSGKTGEFVVRGSDPDKNFIVYDNIPIYHSGHYFGSFSPFNAEIIESIKIQKNGGQGSSFGGRIGGNIQLKSKNTLADSIHAHVGLGSSFYSSSIHFPIVKRKLSGIVGFRRSYPSSFGSIKIDSLNSFVFQESEVASALSGKGAITLLNYDFQFQDVNAKLIYQVTKKHKIELSGIYISDEIDLGVISGPQNIEARDTMSIRNFGISLLSTSYWSNRFKSINSFSNSIYSEKTRAFDMKGSQTDFSIFNIKNEELAFKNLNVFSINDKQKIDFGLETNLYNVINSYETEGASTNRHKDDLALVNSLYADYKWLRLLKKLSLSVGVRASHLGPKNKLFFEPRVFANYYLSKQLTFRLTSGVHHQFISNIYGIKTTNLGGVNSVNWQVSDGESVLVPKSTHIATGFIYQKNDWVIDFEAYYKRIEDITSGSFFVDNTVLNSVYGGYSNSGIDFLVKKRYKKLELWAAYSLLNSNASFDTLEFEYIWNQRNILNIVGGYQIKNLKLSLGWKYANSFKNDIIRTKFIAGAPSQVPSNGGVNQGQEPPEMNFIEGSVPEEGEYLSSAHQLDVSMSYCLYSKNKKIKFIAGGAINNIYDNRMIIGQLNRSVPGPPGIFVRANKTGFGRLYNFSFKLLWQ